MALRRIGRLAALEQLEVRAQARERSSQLVRRVRDELALRAQRRLELAEHRVEARCEPAELVTTACGDPPREVARARDLLDRGGEAFHRSERGPAYERAEPRRQQNGRERELREHDSCLGERAVDVVEGPGELESDSVAEWLDVDPETRLLRLSGREELLAPPRRDLPHLGRHERGHRLAEVGADHVAIRVDELSEDVLASGHHVGSAAEREAAVPLSRPAVGGRRGLGKRAVDLVEQLVLDEEVHRHRGADGRDRDRGRGEQRHAQAEAHGSLSTYPTPRTVWMTRDSPPLSSLRRR